MYEVALHLPKLAISILRRFPAEVQHLFFSGGVFKAGSLLLDTFKKAVNDSLPGAVIRSAILPGVLGAVLCGWDLAGVELAEERISCLSRYID